MSTPASKQTLDSLKQILKDISAEFEAIFPGMMKLRADLTEIKADSKEKEGTVLALLSKVEDLLIGCYFITHELISSVQMLLNTTIAYEKRYYIQNINLCICEGYDYFRGQENNGVWSLAKPYILELNNPILQSYAIMIDHELVKLGEMYYNKKMRNSTAHYDQPIKRSELLNSITNEDVYCKAVSEFMLVHLRINQISIAIFAIISQINNQKLSVSLKEDDSILDFKALLEEKLAGTFSSSEKLRSVSCESLIKISNSIDLLLKDYLKAESLQEYFTKKGLTVPPNIQVINQLVLLRIMINFIRCDLTCSTRAYMNSESSIERSVHLRRIYLTEVAALTHLYGYNADKKKKSLWQQLMLLDVNLDERAMAPLQEKFEDITAELDRTRRNLYIHFREGAELNIFKRYKEYKNLNQIEELNRALNLLNLCEEVDYYTMTVFLRLNKEEQKVEEEINVAYNTMFIKMQSVIKKLNASEEIKSKTINMVEEIKNNLDNILKFENK